MSGARDRPNSSTVVLADDNKPVKFLRLPQVKERIGLSSSEIYRRIKAGTFPRPFNLTKTRVAWLESDIGAWQCALLGSQETSDAGPTAPAPEEIMPARLIRLPDVLQRTGLGKTSVYELIKVGAFPRPVQLTRTRVAWREADIQAWVTEKISGRPLQSESTVPIIRTCRPEIVPPKRIWRSKMHRPTQYVATGNWSLDNRKGREQAQALVTIMRANQAPNLLVTQVKSLMGVEKLGGVAVGFLTELATAAIS